MKNVLIYYPDGTRSYYEIGGVIGGFEGKVTVTNIEILDKVVSVTFSNGESFAYHLPYSCKLS